MTEALQVAVSQLSSLLLWPVVVLLLLAVAQALVLLGELAVEALRRRGPPRALRSLGEIPPAMASRLGIGRLSAERELDPTADGVLLVDRIEAWLARRLDRARRLSRLGPMLGLAGTLIPLGPALTALATNDLQMLADRLVLAFGTTVLGLFAGALGWLIASTQERWYRLDLAELRHALEAGETDEVGAASEPVDAAPATAVAS